MDFDLIKKKFELIGARVKVAPFGRRDRSDVDILIDVQKDKKGEFFEIRLRDVDDSPEALIPDIDPKDSHLLLMVKNNDSRENFDRFLCGHDERQWYVAGVPSSPANIQTAKEALMPESVINALERNGVKTKNRTKRKNEAFKRQGEWFFIPVDINPDPNMILKKEPISRGAGSTSHIVEFLYREGGVKVYVTPRYPNGLTEEEYKKVLTENPNFKALRWDVRTRDAQVYAKGKVKHKDHKTINLPGWHLVLMNTEPRSTAGRNIAFLD